MKSPLRAAVFSALLFLTPSCAHFDVADALFTGVCVASEASCLKSCKADYRQFGGAFAYESCRNSCQPGGRDGCS